MNSSIADFIFDDDFKEYLKSEDGVKYITGVDERLGQSLKKYKRRIIYKNIGISILLISIPFILYFF